MSEDTDLFLTLKDDYREALEQYNDALLSLETSPEDRVSLEQASRQLHNIKGFANRMGAPTLGQLAHIFEDVLGAVTEGRLPFYESLANLFFAGLDVFVHYLRTRAVDAGKVADLVAEAEPLLFTAVDEEITPEDMEPLLPDFIAAARDNIEAINRGLFILEKEPANSDGLQEVYRNAHSLKGSAMTMGFERMGKLAHHMEDVLRALQKNHLPAAKEVCDALYETNDALTVMLDTLAASKRIKVDAESTMARLANLLPGLKSTPHIIETPARSSAEPAAVIESGLPAMDTVRVPTAKLDELVNLAAEAAVAQIHLASEISRFDQLRDRWQQLRFQETGVLQTADTRRRGEREAGLVSQISELADSLEEMSRSLQEAAESAGRHVETLQRRSMEIRMLPLALVLNTMPRAVRDLSRQFGKKVNFIVEGEGTTIDKRILEQLGDPLIHLLRNALDHGLETPEERARADKPPTGTIRLQAKQEGGKVLLILEDDGRGIDPEMLKKSAIDKGLVDRREIAAWTQGQLLELIFLPGLSTSGFVTDVSGRGVGMDVVRANVERLKGLVEVTSEVGKGTTFTISLPLTLATVHALLVNCAGEILAIPTFSVSKSFHIPLQELKSIQGRRAIVHQGEILPVRSLALTLGWSERNGDLAAQDKAVAVLLQAGERKVSFIVDDIVGEREIVSKDLGSHLKKVDYIAGATILGSGEVSLILDVPQLLWRGLAETRAQRRESPIAESVLPRGQLILVVEDQVVTRQMEKSILEAAGYQVVTAENGLEALNILGQQGFDLVISDILMPKMDGFTLTREIRANERTKDLPVVIVSSMESEEDKLRGLEVGASAYLVKSSFDQKHLIQTIEALLGKKSSQQGV
jgi:two-component system chemotaxis sensor kinase CheA